MRHFEWHICILFFSRNWMKFYKGEQKTNKLTTFANKGLWYE